MGIVHNRSKMKWTLCLFFVASVATALPARDKRAFSLFSVVTFPNEECVTNMEGQRGICLTAEECQTDGNVRAMASGNCASGFGVCCFKSANTFPVTIRSNLVNIQNTDFPMAETALNGATVPAAITRLVNVQGQGNVCAVKFEFLNAVVTAPLVGAAAVVGGAAAVVGGTCATDQIFVTTPNRNPAAGFVPGFLCGTLTGQHMFVDVMPGTNAMAAVLNINTGAAIGPRTWQIRIRCIDCNDVARLPPAGCLQYFTGLAGTITSFNGALMGGAQTMLINQNYAVCIKRGPGMSSVEFTEAAPLPVDTFALGAPDTTSPGVPLVGEVSGKTGVGTASCPTQFVLIGGLEICGGHLNPLNGENMPGPVRSDTFRIQVVSDAAGAVGGTGSAPGSGFQLRYRQL